MRYFKRWSRLNAIPAAALAALLPVWFGASFAQAQDAEVPYDLEKFRPVLDDSKLQAPVSSPALIERGMFAGASNDYFYLDDTGQYMSFTADGKGKRSELRQLTGEWDTATPTPRRLVARVKVFEPETPSLQQLSFMLVHDKKTGNQGLNKPLIRLTRRGKYRNTSDHLWASITVPADPGKPISLENRTTQYVDLGPRPDGFFHAEIRVQNSQMLVLIDGETKVDMDVSYWDGLDSYFKAGVYNHDAGKSKVQFSWLDYSETLGNSGNDDAAVEAEPEPEPEPEAPAPAAEPE